MNTSQLPAALRELADRIEAANLLEGNRCSVKIHCYDCADRDTLAAWARMMRRPRADQNSGTHWIRDSGDGGDITVFYEPGLLSGTKTIVMEEEQDISSLLAGVSEVCEFCGREWTEGKDSSHNGGCCDQDAANMPEESETT